MCTMRLKGGKGQVCPTISAAGPNLRDRSHDCTYSSDTIEMCLEGNNGGPTR